MTAPQPGTVAIALAAGLLTVAGMLVAMRVAGPTTHDYALGSLRLEVSPSFSGKAQVYVPIVGWQLEAPVFSAPYAIRAEPRRVSAVAVVRAAHGFRRTVERTKADVKDAAIRAFVRAFAFALAGGLAAGCVVALALRAFRRRWGTAARAGAACFFLAVLLTAASGLWLWQSLDVAAFKRARISSGHGKALVTARRDLAADSGELEFLQDLAKLVARATGTELSVPSS